MNDNEIELNVCRSCDALLSLEPKKLSSHNNSPAIYKDCINFRNES